MPARNTRRPARPTRVRLSLEVLAARWLPSVVVPELEPNDTLDLAVLLGDPLADAIAATGTVAAGSADVDWFAFSLAAPARVSLAASAGVVGLYNSDPWSFADPDGGAGHRLLAQQEGAGTLLRELPAGSYFAAVSGAGNRDFHPFLADSGSPGGGADYQLNLTATPVTAGPVLGFEAAPLVIRVALAAPLDLNTVFPGDTVALYAGTDPTTAVPVNLAWVNVSAEACEIQVAPLAALPAGDYVLRLAGDTAANVSVLTDLTGVPLGTDADHPTGQDILIPFVVTGGETGDTLAGAHDLGDLTGSAARVEGTIGDDPLHDPYSPDPLAANPAADVDYYTFQVTGLGRHALTAEVFAGRVGSRLDAGLSLFRLDAATGQLHLIAANANTRNGAATTNGMVPLFTDPVVFAGLEAGSYVLAVSSNGNTPDPYQGLTAGADGVFDPNLPHSGTAGGSTGRYVLNVTLRPAPAAAEVVSVSPIGGGAPTTFEVQFTRAVNLQALAYAAFNQPTPGELRAVFITDGTATYFPRLVGYDTDTNTARFLMLDRLPAGAFELHLSGANGLTDFADQPLAGGEFVLPFTVAAAAPELVRNTAGGADLGTLFPHELQSGVGVARDGAAEPVDGYRFTVLQQRTYTFTLDRGALPAEVVIALYDSAGNLMADATAVPTGDAIQAFLDPGTYEVRVTGWAGADPVAYRLALQLGDSGDNPPPLTVGPRPAAATNLVTVRAVTPPPPADPAPPPATPTPSPAAPTPSPATPLPTTPAFAGLPMPSSGATGATVTRLTPDGLTTPPAQVVALPPATVTAVATTTAPLLGTDAPAAGDPACVAPPATSVLAPAALQTWAADELVVAVAPMPTAVAERTAVAPEPTAVAPAVPSEVLASLQSGPLGGATPETSRESFALAAPPPRSVEPAAVATAVAAVLAAEPQPTEGGGWWAVAAAAAVGGGVGAGVGVGVRRANAHTRRAGFDCDRGGSPDRITL